MIEEELTITEADWGLYIVLKEGTIVDNSNVLPRIQHVIDLCRQKEKKKILVDASSAQRDVSVSKLFSAGEFLLDLKVIGYKIAFYAPHLADHLDSKFMENVGQNRGNFIRYFSDMNEAKKWLV